MAIHWKIPFKTRHADALLTVNVYDDSFTGTAVVLKGAAQPFETQEDTSDDIFTPVRKQSGYLRIVDDGFAADGVTAFDWRDFIPTTDTDRPVTLTDASNNVLWQGFLQAQNFGATLFGNPQNREFPVQCSLSVTQGIDINFAQTQIRNFAYLLKVIIDSIPATSRPNRVIVQGDAVTWLSKCVDWQNFVENDNDNQPEAKHKMFDCLEEMCKFWGWTARTHQRDLYLLSPDDNSETDLTPITYANLATLADGGTITVTTESYATVQVTGGFASTNNKDYQMRGISQATFNASPNTADSNVIDVFDNDLEAEMEEEGWTYGITYGDGFIAKTGDVLEEERLGFTVSAVSGNASLNRVKKYNGQEAGYGDAMNVIMIKKTYGSGLLPVAYVNIETTYQHSFSDGFFRFFGETYRGADKYEEGNFFAGNKDMFVRLGIGTSRLDATWWDGHAWGSDPVIFRMTLGNKKPEMFTRYRTGSGFDIQSEETSIINTGSAMYGYLYIDLFGSDNMPDTTGQRDFNIKDFMVEFKKNNTVVKTQYPNSGWYEIKDKDIKDRPYKSTNGNAIKDEASVDSIFASENTMKPGYGIVLNPDGSYLTSLTFGSNSEHPEQHYIDRMTDYWATSKRKIEAELLTHDGTAATAAAGISPQKMVQIDGTTLYPYSISHKWRDDELSLVTMETEISEPPVVVKYTVSGVVTDGSNPLSGVVVTLGSLTTTTGSDGSYSFEDVDAGSYTLSATKSGYTFTPITLAVLADTMQNITMSVVVVTYTVSGNVTDGTNMLSGVVVTLGNQSVTSGNNGAFTFNNVEAGTYTLSASKSGYSFVPISLVVTGDTTQLIEMLPYDAEVEYLQTDGSSYINTDVKIASTVKFDFKFYVPKGTVVLFGGRYASQQKQMYLIKDTGNSYRCYRWYFNTSSYAGAQVDGNTPAGDHTFSNTANSRICVMDGTTSATAPAATFSSDVDFFIFVVSLNGTPNAGTSGTRLYSGYAKMYSSGTLVRDFIAVRKNGVGYLYDKVSGTLFGNAGTGSFTYGNDK